MNDPPVISASGETDNPYAIAATYRCMGVLEDLADGWEVWNEEPQGRVILAYRTDIFDTQAFPAPCLPTIAVAPGASPNDPPERRAQSSAWHTAFYLEPTVRVTQVDTTSPSRDQAVETAVDIASRFTSGEIDYRSVYQLPREDYLDKLDQLIGRE